MGIKGTKVGEGPGMGSMPKGKGGAGRNPDHPSYGGKIGRRTNLSKPGCEAKSPRESGKANKVPATKCYAQGPQKMG